MHGKDNSIFLSLWPEYDDTKLVKNTMTIAVQINGKLRGQIDVDTSMEKNNILMEAKSHNNVSTHLDGKELIKEIYIPNKLINFVVK